MSSYKGHTLFAFILSLLFFTNPLLIALTIIGANIPDFDHKYKSNRVYQIIIFGLLIFILLYILNLPYYIAFIIVFIGIIFLFSNHRGFTHSIFGLITLATSFILIILLTYKLAIQITSISFEAGHYLLLVIIIILGFIFLNKRIFPIFLVLFLFSTLILGFGEIGLFEIAGSLYLGLISHIILDAFTPSGVKLLNPLSSKRIHKKFAIFLLLIIIAIAIYSHFIVLVGSRGGWFL